MKRLTEVWRTDDGQIFETEEAAKEYEEKSMRLNAIRRLRYYAKRMYRMDICMDGTMEALAACGFVYHPEKDQFAERYQSLMQREPIYDELPYRRGSIAERSCGVVDSAGWTGKGRVK